MKIYLVYGESAFGNDVYLTGVTRSLEKAQDLIQDTYFLGREYRELGFKKQKRLLKPKKWRSSRTDGVYEGGIYEIEVTE